MKKQVIALLTASMVAFSTVAAHAFGIEGVIFGDYTSVSSSYKTQAQLDALNGFHYTRAYLTLKDKVSDDVSVRLTLDQKDLGTVASGGAVFVKYAYADLNLAGVTTLRAGQLQTPWIDFEEGLWTYRYAFKTFEDQIGALSSSDLGAALVGNFGDGTFNYYVGMYNGEGYQNKPNNSGSMFAGRGDFKFGNFGIAGYYSSNTNPGGVLTTQTRTIGQLYYKDDMFTLAGQYLSLDDGALGTAFISGTGYSIWGHTKIPGLEALRLVLRYDSIQNKSANTTSETAFIYGLSYRIARTTEVGIFGQSVSNATGSGIGINSSNPVAGNSDSQISVNLLTGF